MTSGTGFTLLDSGGTSAAGEVLGRIRDDQAVINRAEAAKLADVLAWCELHTTDDRGDAATFGDTPVLLGGEGCPWIREYTTNELATALHLSPAGARSLVSDVLELAFRLPRLWAKVQSGDVPGWRARRVADLTQSLSMAAAGFVDSQVAEFAGRMGAAAVERLVGEAIGRYMPELAAKRREEGADQRHFDVDEQQVSFEGTCHVDGDMDLADASDLNAVVSFKAQKMKDLGCDLPLDQRRALAVGELAREQLSLMQGLDTPVARPSRPALDQRVGDVLAGNPEPGRFGRRDLTIYAHLNLDATTGSTVDPNAVVALEGHGGPLVTLGTLREWLDISGNVHITIRPVIDLNADLVSNSRFATSLQREQVTLRDKTCAAPYCERPARRLDLVHIDEWVDPHIGSPPGDPPRPQTRSSNLGTLCRHHHRAKTFTGWDYDQLIPGVFLWCSPHGLKYLTFAGQTVDLH